MISVVVPIYNEEDLVVQFHEAVASALEGSRTPWEAVYVNDGSTDCSLELLRALQAGDSHVVIVELSRNWGHMGALHAGLQTDHAGEHPGKGFDIAPTATAHRPPTRPVDKGEQAVIAEEEQKGSGGKGSNLAGRGRPDGGGHGLEIVFDHIGHEAVLNGPLL